MKSKLTSAKRSKKKALPVIPMTGISAVAQLAEGYQRRKDEDAAFALKYPEHAKQSKILKQSQPVGEFLDWAFNEKGWELCEYNGAEERNFSIGKRIEEILAQYFDIDLNKIESENRAMLEEIRAKQ